MVETIYELPETPAYHEDIPKLTQDDPVDADEVVNPLIQKVLENTHAVKKKLDGIQASKGQPDGIAGLDSSGKVPAAQLPEIDVSGSINAHNTSNAAHSDIRGLISKYKPQFFPVTIPATNAGVVGSVSGTFPACTANETTCIVDAAPTAASQDVFHECGFWLKTISPTGFTYTVDSNLTAAMPICIMVQEV